MLTPNAITPGLPINTPVPPLPGQFLATTMVDTRSTASLEDEEATTPPPLGPAREDGVQDDDDGATITISKKTHATLKKKAAALTKCDREYKKLYNDYNKLYKQYEGLYKVSENNENLMMEREKLLDDAHKKIAELQKLLRKNGKIHESELNSQVVDKTVETSKFQLFRTVKFVENDKDLEDVTTDVADMLGESYLKDNKLTKKEFVAKYQDSTNKGIKLGRQYVQSEGKKRAKGKQNSGQTIFYCVLHYSTFCALCPILLLNVLKVRKILGKPFFYCVLHYSTFCALCPILLLFSHRLLHEEQ